MQVSPRVVPVILALGLLLAPLAAQAQPAQRVYRVGLLATGTTRPDLSEAFHAGLRDRGYVEGRNLALEFR